MHFLDAVRNYAINNENKKIGIIYEECFEGMVTKTKHIKLVSSESMLDKLSTFGSERRMPRNVSITFGDARFMAPLDSITALYDHETVLFNRYRRNLRKVWTTFRYNFEKQCKALEKKVITHTNTRKKLVKFVRSLILPRVPYPKWFDDRYVTQENPIKEMLSSLPNKEYDRLETFLMQHLGHLLDANDEYSPLMEKIEDRRNTASSNLEYEKSPSLQKFFIILFSVVQDIYMLCNYLLEGQEYDNYIFIVGAVHAQSMSQYLNELPSKKYSKVYRSNESGCIDMSKSMSGPISDPMFAVDDSVSLLRIDNTNYP